MSFPQNSLPLSTSLDCTTIRSTGAKTQPNSARRGGNKQVQLTELQRVRFLYRSCTIRTDGCCIDSTTDTPQSRFAGVKAPARGTFLPFSEGFRGCLGRRFAEVEIAAVIAVLFHGHKATLKLLPGENWADAAKRVQLALDKSSNQFTMGVRKDIGVVWEERK